MSGVQPPLPETPPQGAHPEAPRRILPVSSRAAQGSGDLTKLSAQPFGQKPPSSL